jgi:hypothetical protein
VSVTNNNVHHRTDREGEEEEWSYSSTLSLTSALDREGDQRHSPATLPPGMNRYPLYGSLGGPHDWSDERGKSLPQPRFDPRNVQPNASRYTDWAILAHFRD